MQELVNLVRGLEVSPIALLDIALTALLIYGLLSLIRGTRAVRLVIGVTTLYAVYAAAQFLGLQLVSQILQTGAVVGLLALVVVFQPELRRALERIGRVGSLGWLFGAGTQGVERVAGEIAHAATVLSAKRQGALIVIERETGLEDTAEAGVMIHADLSTELLRTIFAPRTPLHDGAVIVRGPRIIAAGVVLPLSETSLHGERFGTRHRAALGITEQTDAVAVIVSEETGTMSLAERGRLVRQADQERLRSSLVALLKPGGARSRPLFSTASGGTGPVVRLRLPDRPRLLRRDGAQRGAGRGGRAGRGRARPAAAAAPPTPGPTPSAAAGARPPAGAAAASQVERP